VTHTATEANPWWEVKLTAAVPVERVVVWNRTDNGAGVRLAGFRVQLLDESRKVLWQEGTKPEQVPNPSREFPHRGRVASALAGVSATQNPNYWEPMGFLVYLREARTLLEGKDPGPHPIEAARRAKALAEDKDVTARLVRQQPNNPRLWVAR